MRAEFLIKCAKTRILSSLLYKALDGEELVKLLKEALSRALSDRVREFLLSLFAEIERLGGAKSLRTEDIERIMRMAEEFLGEDLFSAARKQIFEGVMRGYELGLGMSFSERDMESARLAARASYMPMKNYWEERLKPKMEELFRQAVSEGWSRRRLAEKLEEMFGKHIEADMHYFETVADLAIYRAREMGRISGFVRAGVQYVRVESVLDRRCCKICRAMHGRTIAVREIQAQIGEFLRAAEAGDLDGIKKAWPMWNTKMFREAGLDSPYVRTRDMTRMGLRTPPFHFRCRCTLVAHFEPASDWERIRQRVVDGERISVKEATEILEKALRAKWGSHKKHGKLTARYHFETHKYDVGAKNLEEYNRKLFELIRRGNRKAFLVIRDKIRERGGFPQLYIYDPKTKHLVVINVKGWQIATFYKNSEFMKWLHKKDAFVELPIKGVQKWIGFVRDLLRR